MSWLDRLKEGAYTSPSGIRMVFSYEDVSKFFEKKGGGFEFPDANGTFVQGTGRTSRRLPMRLFFWGDDYDLEADQFEELLGERGIGKLEHPIYGTIDVVPLGAIKREDRLKTAANQAEIRLTFWETIGLVYPTPQSDPGSEVLAAVDDYNAAASTAFENVTSLSSAVERANLKAVYQTLVDSVDTVLSGIASTKDAVNQQFNAIVDSINTSIDVLIAEPLTLAFQTVQMIQSPARAVTAVLARLSAYADLTSSIISGDDAVEAPGLDSQNSNDFHARDLYASTYVTGSILSVVNNQFVTQTDAIGAAEEILTQFEAVTNWRDDNFESLSEVDTGESYQSLLDAVALTAGFLVEISFSLKQERMITLDRNRTIIDLVAELYGSIDDQLDFFITSNNLTGSEILELPRGRNIVYYV